VAPVLEGNHVVVEVVRAGVPVLAGCFYDQTTTRLHHGQEGSQSLSHHDGLRPHMVARVNMSGHSSNRFSQPVEVRRNNHHSSSWSVRAARFLSMVRVAAQPS